MEISGSSDEKKIPVGVVLLLFLICAAILISSWPSLTGRYYLDTEGHFRSVPYFREPSLSWQKIHDVIFSNPYPAARRFLPTFSFLVENRLFGMSPKSGRIINLFVHFLNIFLVFILLRRILRLLGRGGPRSNTTALVGSLLWGVNPFHADAVLYVIQRMTLMSASFYLGGALVYLEARERKKAWLWWLLLSVFFFGGLACKQNAVLLPVGLVVLELALPTKSGESSRIRLKRLFSLIAVLVCLPISAALILGYNLTGILGIFSDTAGREFSAVERLLTEGRVLVDYLTLLFLPLPGRLSFIFKYQLSRSLFLPWTTIAAWGFIGCLAGFAFFARKRNPLIWLAVGWFFINHILESTAIPLEIAFVHRNYLPSVFLFLPIAWWIVSQDRKQLITTVSISLVTVLFLLGWNLRANVWGNPVKFWEDGIRKAPGSLRSYINLGVLRDIQGRSIDAMAIYHQGAESAFEEPPAAWSALYGCMGIASMNLKQLNQAEMYLDKAISIAPLPDNLLNMAKLQLLLKNYDRANAALNKLGRIRPQHQKLHFIRAKIFLAQERIEEAVAELVKELTLYPGNQEARKLLLSLQNQGSHSD